MDKYARSKVDKSRELKTPKKKTGGRKAGTPNRITSDIKARIKTFVENEFDNVVADFSGLDAKDKVLLFEKFLNYVLPKQRWAGIDVTSDGRGLFEGITDDELDAKIAELERKLGK